jgi:hypothetical protein
MPASKAVRPQSNQPWTKVLPVTGRFDYNQKLGDLKELLQKGGYRDFSRKILPLPRLAAYPTLKGAISAAKIAQKYHLAPTAINHSSKLMSAMQELFQLFSCLFQLCRRCFVRRQNQSSRRVGDAQGIRKSISICLELWGLSPSLRSGFSRRGIPVAGRTGWSGTED